MLVVNNKKYFAQQINSSKAYQFTSYYHYSGVGFKKAQVNVGIYRHEDKKLVGVLQWGVSAQEGIRLDRYVKEPITKDQYLELNRFCMADSEEKNSESMAISLGIKWIQKNFPNIKLLVSYAGRKEGNYGYIYQATNWDYLGYFISPGFWLIDGNEKHALTLWHTFKQYCNTNLTMKEGLCEHFRDVRQTWTKQFIYVKRLDNSLTLASEVLPYPKPSNEFPIKTKEEVFKEDKTITGSTLQRGDEPNYFYEDDELMFTRRTLIRRGELKVIEYEYAVYNEDGQFIQKYQDVDDIKMEGYVKYGILKAAKDENNHKYKKHHFIRQEKGYDFPLEIEVESICVIDEIPFYTYVDAARYLKCSKQAVNQAKRLNQKIIKGKQICWSV